jgi:hypothetical protein
MDGRTLFFDDRLNAGVELVHAALDRHGKQGQDFLQFHSVHSM